MLNGRQCFSVSFLHYKNLFINFTAFHALQLIGSLPLFLIKLSQAAVNCTECHSILNLI